MGVLKLITQLIKTTKLSSPPKCCDLEFKVKEDRAPKSPFNRVQLYSLNREKCEILLEREEYRIGDNILFFIENPSSVLVKRKSIIVAFNYISLKINPLTNHLVKYTLEFDNLIDDNTIMGLQSCTINNNGKDEHL